MTQTVIQQSHPLISAHLQKGCHLFILSVLIRSCILVRLLRSRTSTIISLVDQDDKYSSKNHSQTKIQIMKNVSNRLFDQILKMIFCTFHSI